MRAETGRDHTDGPQDRTVIGPDLIRGGSQPIPAGCGHVFDKGVDLGFGFFRQSANARSDQGYIYIGVEPKREIRDGIWFAFAEGLFQKRADSGIAERATAGHANSTGEAHNGNARIGFYEGQPAFHSPPCRMPSGAKQGGGVR